MGMTKKPPPAASPALKPAVESGDGAPHSGFKKVEVNVKVPVWPLASMQEKRLAVVSLSYPFRYPLIDFAALPP